VNATGIYIYYQLRRREGKRITDIRKGGGFLNLFKEEGEGAVVSFQPGTEKTSGKGRGTERGEDYCCGGPGWRGENEMDGT